MDRSRPVRTLKYATLCRGIAHECLIQLLKNICRNRKPYLHFNRYCFMKKILIPVWILVLGVLLVTASSCGKEDQGEIDQALIEDYLEDNNLVSQKTNSGLHYIINTPGGTDKPGISDVVQFAYEGTLLNGDVFDSSTNAQYPLNNLIEGFKEGLQLFGKGGSGILIIPSKLGYGSDALNGIPANSVLVFEITLIDFE